MSNDQPPEWKRMWGKLLGEVYRLQHKMKLDCDAAPEQIFALLNGFENAIEDELNNLGYIPRHLLESAETILLDYENNPARLKELAGYYTIESDFEAIGIDRTQARRLFTYWKAQGAFENVIAKLEGSEHSPAELKAFKLKPNDLRE